MWDRSVPHVEDWLPATLHGHARTLCLYSWTYRGTREKPGLILGLEAMKGAACVGSLLRVHAANADAALEHFDRRELINGIYQRQLVRVATDLGEMAAYAYIARPDHEQYCGALPETEAAQLIATATGSRGTSLDYLEQCMTALHRQDIREPALERLLASAKTLDR